MQHEIIICIQILVLIFSLYIIGRLIFMKEGTNERTLMLLCALTSILFAYAGFMETVSSTKEMALLSVKFQYLGSTSFILLYLLFTFHYCKTKPPRILIGIALAVFAVLITVTSTIEYHSLYYQNVTWCTDGWFPHLSTSNGPFYYVFVLYILSIGFSVEYVCIKALRNMPLTKAKRLNIHFIMVSPIVPIVAMLTYALKITSTYDITPMSTLLCTSLIIFALQRHRAFDVVASAREQMVEETQDPIIIVDIDMDLLDVNPAALALFPEITDNDPEFFFQEFGFLDASTFMERESTEIERLGRFYQIHINRVFDEDGKTQGFATTFFDITNEKENLKQLTQMKEAADAANQAKSNFLANISHEVRTPMNAILGMSELIIEESVGRKVYDFAVDIRLASNNLLSIINDILDMSKLDSGHLDLVPSSYHTKFLLDEVIHLSTMSASSKCLQFVSQVDDTLPYELFGDSIRVRQILLNLINNAIKFTKKGTVSLTVTGERLDDSEVMLDFTVTDTGIGLKNDDLELIFSHFQQVDSTSSRSMQGVGLGLTITKNLVHLMNGDITVESTYGVGSTFRATIRQKILDNRKLSEVTIHKNMVDNYQRKIFHAPDIKVLIVDDNKINLKVASSLLANYEFQIDLADSGQEAINKVKEKHYDLIFMDHMMPGMDGVETVSHIQNECGENGTHAYIIALTANAFGDTKDMFLENGFHAFLAKPIEPEQLFKVLDSAVPNDKKNTAQVAAHDYDSSELERIAMKNVDVSAGVKRRSMGIEGYLELLEIFYVDGTQKVQLITDLIANRDYQNYVIEVHALKSVAATIGATALSERAKAHEFHGKDEDYDFILKDYEGLLFDYRCLLDEAKRVLTQEGRLNNPSDRNIPKEHIEEEELMTRLNEVLSMVEHFHPKDAAEKINDLINYDVPEDVSELLALCKTKLKLYDDDAVEDLLREYIETKEE